MTPTVTPNHMVHDDSYLVLSEARELLAEKRRERWNNVAGVVFTTALIVAIVVGFLI